MPRCVYNVVCVCAGNLDDSAGKALERWGQHLSAAIWSTLRASCACSVRSVLAVFAAVAATPSVWATRCSSLLALSLTPARACPHTEVSVITAPK